MKRILVVAPHCDDETLGVGGSIARFVREGCDVIVAVMTGRGTEPHPLAKTLEEPPVRSEARDAMKILGVRELIFENIPAALVSDQPGYKVNQAAEAVVKSVKPEIIFLPFCWDVQLDHRTLTHAFNLAWRPHTDFGKRIRDVYMYETASETHWQISGYEPPFDPNTWVNISEHLVTKLESLACYKSQIRPFPDARSIEAVEALARWRGSQVSCRAAEAFVSVRRLV